MSNLIFFGLFVCGYLLVFFLLDWCVNKSPKWRLLLGLLALSAGYIITDYRLFYVMFFSGEAAMRTTSYIPRFESPGSAMREALGVLLNGHYHSGDLHRTIILPVCLLYFAVLNLRYFLERRFKDMLSDRYNWMMFLLGLNALIYGLNHIHGFKVFIETVIPPLKGVSVARALWMNPFLWYFSFMVVMCRVKVKELSIILCMLAFVVLCLRHEAYNDIRLNIRSLDVYQSVREAVKGKDNTEERPFTWKEFFSPVLFDKIKADIGYSGEWSIAYGMHPAVLQYNKIATLDGYHNAYSQRRKEEFRRLIAPELAVDEEHRNGFDRWGGRAYIYSPELDFRPTREARGESVMHIDPAAFREMGGKYVFSLVEVSNADDLGLRSVGTYTDEASPYTMHVYKTID